MARLSHSYLGYLRSLQMSSTQIFVFVEGKQCDPYFFSSICSTVFARHIRYEIFTASQLPGDAGGKKALYAFFSFLRKKGMLVSDFGGQKTVCVFIVDKDIDDIRRAKKRSPHLVYTQHYDVQNYVFEFGDLVKAGAAAASVDPRRLQPVLGDARDWCRRVALLWKDWVGLCLLLIEDNIPCEANYRVVSPIQTRLCGPTEENKLHALISTIACRYGIPVAEMRQRVRTSTKKVERYCRRAEHHRIFKGKWFSSILADEISRIMAGNSYDSSGLVGRLPQAVAVTLDFSAPWANYFRHSLNVVGSLLNSSNN